MAIDLTTPRTRRSMLLGAFCAVGALAVGALARPDRVSALDPDDIVLGGNTTQDETGATVIRNQGTDAPGLMVDAAGGGLAFGATYRGPSPGMAIEGYSYQSTGVEGYAAGSNQIGVRGRSEGGTGVLGYSGPYTGSTTPASRAKIGVYGLASEDANATGVYGLSTKGRGGVFQGKVAHLRLPPSSAATHPTAGQPGDIFVDASYRMWFCKGGASWKLIV